MEPLVETSHKKIMTVIRNSWEKYDENIRFGWHDRRTELKQYTPQPPLLQSKGIMTSFLLYSVNC